MRTTLIAFATLAARCYLGKFEGMISHFVAIAIISSLLLDIRKYYIRNYKNPEYPYK